MQFGKIMVDNDRYIVIPIVINGTYRTDYEIAPPAHGDNAYIDYWLTHLQDKAWWDNADNQDFLNALNFVANEQSRNLHNIL